MSAREGYSLFELLVTLALISVLAASGAPLLRASVQASRLSSEVNAFVRTVHVARSEAVKTNGEAIVCPSLDGASCAAYADAWASGWLVFANADRDSPARVDEGERVLAFHRVSPGMQVNANRLVFAFHNHARRSTNGTVIFCPATPGPSPRAVVISYTGRPRTALRRSNGKSYRCQR